VALKRLLDDPLSGFGQSDQKATAVVRILCAGDVPLVLQSVHGSGHRSAGQQNFISDGIDGQRAFVHQNFHDRKIAQQQSSLRDAGPVDPFDRLCGLP
jgi:hypothetical protein